MMSYSLQTLMLQGCTLSVVGMLLIAPTVQAQDKEIKLGMSTALTGPAAELGKNMRSGILANIHEVNQAGGIRGYPLRLLSLDDGYEPTRTAPNMRHLIEKDNVLAVIGNVGTPTAIAAIPIANEQKTLFFAPFTGAGVLRKTPPDHYVINYRASYAEETEAMIDALLGQAKLELRDIAFFTQRDGYGDAGYIGGITAMKRHGLKHEETILHVRYERNTLAVEDTVASLLLAERPPKAVVMVGAYAPCAKFITLAKASGLDALFLNVSFVGSRPLARELGTEMDRVIVTQVVPHPTRSQLPIVQEFHAALKEFDPSTAPSFGALEGYIASRILMKALGNIPGAPTREMIVNALEQLQSFDVGLGHPLTLNKQQHQASHQIWPTILRQGKFIPFEWSKIQTVIRAGE